MARAVARRYPAPPALHTPATHSIIVLVFGNKPMPMARLVSELRRGAMAVALCCRRLVRVELLDVDVVSSNA